MPPKPTPGIDFPDLGDRILEILNDLWTFICDLCLVLWSYISGAFWVMWTWPPFASFRNDFTAALVALWDYVTAQPVTSTAIAILAFIAISSVLNVVRACLLYSLHSRQRGALRASYGPYYQSTGHGGNVARPKWRGAKDGNRYRTTYHGSSSRA